MLPARYFLTLSLLFILPSDNVSCTIWSDINRISSSTPVFSLLLRRRTSLFPFLKSPPYILPWHIPSKCATPRQCSTWYDIRCLVGSVFVVLRIWWLLNDWNVVWMFKCLNVRMFECLNASSQGEEEESSCWSAEWDDSPSQHGRRAGELIVELSAELVTNLATISHVRTLTHVFIHSWFWYCIPGTAYQTHAHVVMWDDACSSCLLTHDEWCRLRRGPRIYRSTRRMNARRSC